MGTNRPIRTEGYICSPFLASLGGKGVERGRKGLRFWVLFNI